MIEAKITQENIAEFFKYLRDSDLKEVEFFLGRKSVDEFIKACFSSTKTYLLKTTFDEPLVLGGLKEFKQGNKTIGQVWLLSTIFLYKKKKSVYKYILSKIFEFQNEYTFLFNYIYKTNYSALNWLKQCGFECIDLERNDLKFFYFNKGESNFDLRYFTCK